MFLGPQPARIQIYRIVCFFFNGTFVIDRRIGSIWYFGAQRAPYHKKQVFMNVLKSYMEIFSL